MAERKIEIGILDDDEDMLMFIEGEIKKAGITNYFLFQKGSALLVWFNENSQLVVLDYKLPEGITALEIVREIRSGAINPNCYIIIMTGGNLTNDMILDLWSAKADVFLKKDRDFLPNLTREIQYGLQVIKAKLDAEVEREDLRRQVMDGIQSFEERLNKKRKKDNPE